MTGVSTTLRITIDTNVLVVAPLNRESIPGRILSAWEDGRFALVLSEHVLEEVERTHHKAYFRARLSLDDISGFRRLLRRRAVIVQPAPGVVGVATHPEDDLILATAVSGQVDYLVTGDARLLTQVPTYCGITLLRPADFLARL